MSEREFLITLRRILLSAIDLIDKRCGLGRYVVIVPSADEQKQALALQRKTA